MEDLERRIAQLQVDLDARTAAHQELLVQHQAALTQQQPLLANIEVGAPRADLRLPPLALGSPHHPRSRLPSGRLGSPANHSTAPEQ